MAVRFGSKGSTAFTTIAATLLVAAALAACGGGKGGTDAASDPGPGDLADVPPIDVPAVDAPDVPDVPEDPDVPGTAELPTLPNLTPLVNVFIGTTAAGNVIPGPSVPRGMMKLSPDTNASSSAVEGYNYGDSKIQGFSHTHLEGPGGSTNGYSQILFMPTTGPLKTNVKDYASAFSHDDETAAPGYYAVGLKDYGIQAELTSTAKCGIHRYTFQNAGEARVLIDLARTRGQALMGTLALVGDRRAEGYGKYIVNSLISIGLADTNPTTGESTVYFSAELDRPFLPTSATFPTGDSIGAHLDLSPAAGDVVTVKVGISYISVAQARKNLETECLSESFEDVRAASVAAWNRKLWRAEVTGGTTEQQRIFYTALYHSFLVPVDATEDGKFFSGWDEKGQVVEAKGWKYMTDDWCIWDTGRVTHPLHTIVDPESRSDIAQSLVHTYEAGGWMAKATWNALGDSRCMTANFQFCVIADAYRKGFRGFDVEKAWEGIYKGATQDCVNSLQDITCAYLNQGTPPDYINLGYVSEQCDGIQSASTTLEYAYNDFCIAQFAEAIGKPDQAAIFRARSGNWKNNFDYTMGFSRPKNRDGTWRDPFDLLSDIGFCEADSWKYTWHVQQDMCGLVDAMGGVAKFQAKLDEFFADGHFSMDNEPDFQTPFLYNYIGKAAKTQDLTRNLLARYFKDAPDGLPGNDDSGAMSSWAVFAMMGLYPVAPSDDHYAITSPVFEKTVLHMDPERKAGIDFVIQADDVSDTNRYIQSATLNGVALNQPRIAHADIAKGGTLVLKMGAMPSLWGEALCP
jgi:predicted alpha-1,2-mannosidase